MELYSTFQIKDHYYWVEEVSKPAAKPEAPKVEAKHTAKPATKPARSIRVVEDGGTTYYAPYRRSEPVMIDGWMI